MVGSGVVVGGGVVVGSGVVVGGGAVVGSGVVVGGGVVAGSGVVVGGDVVVVDAGIVVSTMEVEYVVSMVIGVWLSQSTPPPVEHDFSDVTR